MAKLKSIKKLGLALLAMLFVLVPLSLPKNGRVITSHADGPATATWEELVTAFTSVPPEIIGTGQAINPFQIRNAVDFAIMASLINRYSHYANSYSILVNHINMKNTGTTDLFYASVNIPILAEENQDLVRYFFPIGYAFDSETLFTGGLNYNRFTITNIVVDQTLHTKGFAKLEPFARREINGNFVTVVRDASGNGNFDTIKGYNLWSTQGQEPTGSGSSLESPYLISSPEHLAWITARARYGAPFPNETYFRLTQNIDLSGRIWDQFGTPSTRFNATFDFNRFSISGVILEVGSIVSTEKFAIFGSLSTSGRILNFIPSTSWVNHGNYAEAFQQGNGTAGNPYQIVNASQLARVLHLSRTTENISLTNMHFVLNANIDLSAHKWEKIGDFSNPFMGVFNYNGFVVSNIDLGDPLGGPEPLDRLELFFKRDMDGTIFPNKTNILNWNLWTSFASFGFAAGAGSQNDPYQIATPQQLAYLAKQHNENPAFSAGKYFVLTSVIDLSSHLWVQIGSLGNEFAGTFNYNKKSVKHISLESNSSQNVREKELFGGNVLLNNLLNWVPSEYWKDLTLPIPPMEGNGSELDPYIISSPLQFFLPLFLNADHTVSQFDNHFRLQSPNSIIDLDGYLWQSISFHGRLDANRVQIINLRQNIEDGTGFFSDNSTGVIRNWSPNQSWNSPDFIEPFFDGTGTALSPFIISSASQLAYLMRETNNNMFATKGKHFSLTRNINLVNHFWQPIGTVSNPFRGTFHANGFSIINITVSTEAQRNGFMLFGTIDNAIFNSINQKTSWFDTQYRSGSYSGGNGTKANPFVIRTASELALLLFQANSVSYFTVNKYFVLGNDISLVNHAWVPIGFLPEIAPDRAFAGHFDYAGYKVTNIYYEHSELIGHQGTKYELFHGLARNMENEISAVISRWIPTSSWNDYYEQAFSNGDGSLDNPFEITNANQLAYLSYAFSNSATINFSGLSFKLGANIDLSNYLWTPIGTSANPFNGSFHGNGYTISGMVTASGNLGGLFGYVKNVLKTVVIQNVEISNAIVRISSIEGTLSAIGLVAAVTENTELRLIKTSGLIHSDSILAYSVGGLIGYATTTSIHASQSFAEIKATQKSVQTKLTHIGGLVGFANNVTAYNSYFAGSIHASIAAGSSATNKLMVGGLYGFIKGNASTSLFNSFAAAPITTSVVAGASLSRGVLVGELNTLSTERPLASEFGFSYYLSNATINPSMAPFGVIPAGWNVAASIQKREQLSFFQTKSTFTTASNWSNRSSWNFATVWNEVVNERSEFPSLQSFGEYFVIINNTGVLGGKLYFANYDGIQIDNENGNANIVQRKYRYEDKVRFYVEVNEHYLYSRIVKKNGITLQNVLTWETFVQGDITYQSFEITVNANTSGAYSVEFNTASYKLSLSVLQGTDGTKGGNIRINSSNPFEQADYNIPYQTAVTLRAEPVSTDYILVGWYEWIAIEPEGYDNAGGEFEPYWSPIEGSSIPQFLVTMQGREMAFAAEFTKDISLVTIIQLGGDGGIYSFRDAQASATNLNGKMRLNANNKISLEVKEGYTFLGWFLSENDLEPISLDLDFIMTYTEMEYVLYARFDPPVLEEEGGFPLLIVLLIGGGALIIGLSVFMILRKKNSSSMSYRRNYRF